MDNSRRSIWIARVSGKLESLRRDEYQFSLVLSLVIGALVGLVVVAFILLTERLAVPDVSKQQGSGWRRILVPVLGSPRHRLSSGPLVSLRARQRGVPQTKIAIFINDGRMLFRTVVGKFLCCSAACQRDCTGP